jgi:acyl-CoA dehydrogenase
VSAEESVSAEDLQAFRDAMREFLAKRAPREHTRELVEQARTTDEATWLRAAGEIGLQGLLTPESLGGTGVGPAVAAVATGELGAALTIGPYLPTLVGSHLLGGAGDQAAELVRAVAAGQLALAVDWSSLHRPLAGSGAGNDITLNATRPPVPDVLSADRLLLLVDDPAGTALAVIDLTDPTVRREPVRSMDVTRPAGRVVLSGTTPPIIAVTGAAVAEALDLATVLLAAEQLAIIERVLRDDVAYCLEREAFGRKVGSFQAVKHQFAHIYILWEQGVALLDHAIAMMADPSERGPAVDALATFSGPAAVRATTDGLRLLGGIGFTWEHDAHLYFRRARADESLLENIHVRRSRLARALGLRPSATGVPA